MPEVPHPREDHRHAVFVGGRDDLLVANRPAGLNDGRDAGGRGVVDPVAEGEEGVGGHGGALHLETGVLRLDGGDACRVDAAHLAGPDPDGHAVLAVDDGVALDKLGDTPSEEEVFHLLIRRLAFRDDLEVGRQVEVGILNEEAAVDPLEVETKAQRFGPDAAFEKADVLLGGDDIDGALRDDGGDDHLDELPVADRLGRRLVELAVEGDDPAECRLGVGGEGAVVGVEEGIPDRHAAGVGVLHNDACGPFGELFDALEGRVGVTDIVVGELLPLELAGGGDRRLLDVALHVEGGVLMGVLPVAHPLGLFELEGEDGRKLGVLLTEALSEPVGDRPVVGGGMLVDLDGEAEVRFATDPPTLQLIEDGGVVVVVDDDRDVAVVLRRAAQHRRPADVDVLDGGLEGAPLLRHRCLEGVEVDDDHVDRFDAVLGHLGDVLGVVAHSEKPAVNLGMERLHAPVEHLREAGKLGDVLDGDTFLAQQRRRPPRGENLHPKGGEAS